MARIIEASPNVRHASVSAPLAGSGSRAVLMAGDDRARPGRVREEQNWIGGRLGNPSDAAFVPPPENRVLALLEDLVTFMARVGRALVHLVLRRRGIAARFVPPVSIVLAARPAAYAPRSRHWPRRASSAS